MSAFSAAALLLRRLRTETGILLLLFALVALTSFLFAAAPRLLNRVSDDAVRYAVANASPVERDVWLYADGFIGAGTGGGASALQTYGEVREADFPVTIDGLVSNRVQGFTSVRFIVPQSIVDLSVRYQDGVTDAARLTAGRWPVDRGMQLQQIRVGQSTGDTTRPRRPSSRRHCQPPRRTSSARMWVTASTSPSTAAIHSCPRRRS